MNPFYLKRSLSVLLLVFALTPIASYSQNVGISDISITPDPESILELRSTTKGVLLPRLSSGERATLTATPLVAGHKGLTIFNTSTNMYNYWDGTQWVIMQTAAATTGVHIENQNALDQIADFRISGDGTVKGAFGIGAQASFATSRVLIHDASGTAGELQLLVRDNASLPILAVEDVGRVGIGTSAPLAKLHVENNTIDNTIQDLVRLQVHTSSAGNGGGIQFRNRWNGGSTYWTMGRISAIEQNGFGGQLVFSTNLGTGTGDDITTEAMRIDENGQLGLGTTTPNAKFHVRNGLTILNRMDNASSAAYDDADLVLGDNVSTRDGYGGTNGSNLMLQSNDKSTITALDEGNNLGQISYQNLKWTLGENVGWGNQGIMMPVLSGSGTRFVVADNNGNLSTSSSIGSGVVTGSGTTNYLARWTPNGNTLGTGVTYDNGTNVGIGTTNPLQLLEVNGNISLPSSTGNKQIYTWGPTDANWRIGMSASPGFTRNLATSHVEYRTFASGAGQGFAVGDNVTGLSSFEVTGSGSGYDAYFRGDVGIGGNPSYPLHVTKTLSGNWQGRFTNGSSNVYLAHQGGYGIHINTGGTNNSSRYALEVRNASQTHLYVRDDGRVGIGNTAPGYELDVSGNTRTTGDFFGDIHVDDTRNVNTPPTTYNNEVAFDFKNRTVVGAPGAGTYSGMMTFAPWGDNSGNLHHQINFNDGGLYYRTGQPNSATWGAWDRIMTASSVVHDNLGNHTATTNLNMNNHEIDNINYADIRAGNGYGVRFWQSNSYKIHMGSAAEYRYGDVQEYSIKMNMNNDPEGDRGWTWGVDGQTPVASISTAGHMALDGSLFLDCVTCGSTSDPYATAGSSWGNMVLQGRVMSASSNIHLSPPGGNNVVINDSYRAGGGSTGSGDAGLIVEGKAAIGQTTIDASYQLKVNGRLRTTGINETSDRRFKKDILPITNALDKVLTMKGVTYNWKIDEFPEQNFRDELQHGLIAQELEKIVPELVLTGSDGYKSIEYTHLVPVLIEAIKSQQEMIESQTNKLNTQEIGMKQQGSTISELKAEMELNRAQIEVLMNHINGLSSNE